MRNQSLNIYGGLRPGDRLSLGNVYGLGSFEIGKRFAGPGKDSKPSLLDFTL